VHEFLLRVGIQTELATGDLRAVKEETEQVVDKQTWLFSGVRQLLDLGFAHLKKRPQQTAANQFCDALEELDVGVGSGDAEARGGARVSGESIAVAKNHFLQQVEAAGPRGTLGLLQAV